MVNFFLNPKILVEKEIAIKDKKHLHPFLYKNRTFWFEPRDLFRGLKIF